MNISCMIDCNCVILSMHFRYILLLFVVCFHLFTANGKNNATITLHLNNLPKDTSSLIYISMGDSVYYYDTVGLSAAVIKLTVSNPFPVMIMANNLLPSNKVFWVHDGVYDVYYDMDTYKINVENSPLNNDFFSILNIRDSINYLSKAYRIRSWQAMDDFYRKKDTTAKARLDDANSFYKDNELEINRLDSLASDMEYQYYLEHNTSFLALDFIKNKLDCATLDKEKLKQLFAKLDKKLKKYPLYATCKKNLKNPYYVPPAQKGCVPSVQSE